ncbi:MAG: BON domain-containing protein [Pirellulales bacterium]|nr:BON domain-containing protein [Pirellulales bacterium]
MITIRPDQSVQIELVRTALATSSIFDLRQLFVVETDDGLTLRGSVSSYYHKQLAQETALAVADMPLVNDIAVAE